MQHQSGYKEPAQIQCVEDREGHKYEEVWFTGKAGSLEPSRHITSLQNKSHRSKIPEMWQLGMAFLKTNLWYIQQGENSGLQIPKDSINQQATFYKIYCAMYWTL